MGRQSVEWHDNGALVWTWRLTLIVSGVGFALLGVAVVLWATRTPAEVARGDAGYGLPATFGAVALIVAVAGRISSASALRYRNASLPPVPAPSAVVHHVKARSCSVHRRSGIAYLMMAITGGGLVLAALANWNPQPRLSSLLELVLATACAAGCYLAGPAARFVMTPRHLHIDTALHRISVPRHLLGQFSRRGVEVRLDLTSGDHVYFRVDSPLWDVRGGQYRTNGRCQVRTVERIVAMLGEVPPTTHTDDAVVTTSRVGMIALAVGAGILSAAAVVLIAITARLGH
ncbi:hypothetical protein [Micromonospora chersina]|uniref:hypothetical protein n=1 Tax=Micromonospora chersina TaxID=47854 RepID=UPI00371F580C